MHNEHTTPLMKQYFEIKSNYADALLLFQVGDFYELFFDDAKKAASFLGIALTARGKSNGQPIPLCGVPVHTVDHYLAKLVKGGFHVALCNQLEEAKPGSVVKRGVTQVLTPGTLTDARLLDERSASYLLSVYPVKHYFGLVCGELLTSQLLVTDVPADSLKHMDAELTRFFPDEIIVPNVQGISKLVDYFKTCGYCVTIYSCAHEDRKHAHQWLTYQFDQKMLETVFAHEAVTHSLMHFYGYLKKNQAAALPAFNSMRFYSVQDFLMLDAATQTNLELVRNMHDGTKKNTLFELFDRYTTAMGSRMLKKWLVRPLLDEDIITERQKIVQCLVENTMLREQMHTMLLKIGDLERIVGRIALSCALVHDYQALKHALAILQELAGILSAYDSFTVCKTILTYKNEFADLAQFLNDALDDSGEEQIIIKKGFDAELDRVRALARNGHQAIMDLEATEQQKTGIASLKIRYNQVQGYYIEITKANVHAVPDHYIRHQTLVGKERFTTRQLKQMEIDIVDSQMRAAHLEKQIFERIREHVLPYISPLRKVAYALATLDALLGFAGVAYNRGYVKPTFNHDKKFEIVEGKHPVLEMKLSHQCMSNDTHMDEQERLFIITGPNMGGKSTYLRQNALIALLAQCGSFVPAKKADLPIFDRIFTRIGASDNVSEGKSTFLVEMEEVALICSSATENSLVIFDEVGRGTSTFDGLAIAQAVVEYMISTIKSYCLFATHYHELTALASHHPGIKNYHAASKRTKTGFLLLHKIIKGVAQGSFGIDVARLAQLPQPIIDRAYEILKNLITHTNPQLSIFSLQNNESNLVNDQHQIQQLKNRIAELEMHISEYDKLNNRLHSLNMDEMTPKQAFDILWKMKKSNFD